MAKAHLPNLLTIAGVFLLLPQFALTLFFPFPQPPAGQPATLEMINTYFLGNAGAIFLLNIPVWLGQAATLSLLLSNDMPTVSQVLQRAASMLLPVALLAIILQIILASGFLLIIPGLYLAGRLAVATSAQMAERLSNPVTVIQRSLSLTAGHGWRITGILMVFYTVGYVTIFAIGSTFGIVFTLALPGGVGQAVSALFESLLATAMLLVLIVLAAAIYRQLSAIPNKGI